MELCNQYQIWVDLAHTSEQTGKDILSLAQKVMISHVGICELNPKARNKSLSLMKQVAQKGGVIGLIPWTHLTGPTDAHYLDHFKMAIDHGLENHLCIGSDFGAPITTPKNLKSSHHLHDLLKKLPAHAHKLQWDNAYQFLKNTLPS